MQEPKPIASTPIATTDPPKYIIMHTNDIVVVALVSTDVDLGSIRISQTNEQASKHRRLSSTPAQPQLDIFGSLLVSTSGIELVGLPEEELSFFKANVPVTAPASFRMRVPMPFECARLESVPLCISHDKVLITLKRTTSTDEEANTVNELSVKDKTNNNNEH